MTYTRAILSAVIESSRGRLIGLAVFAAYVMAPTDAGGLIHGIPLGGIDAAALIAIGWLAIAGGRLRFASVAAAAMVVFWIAAYAIPGSAGFRARYYSDATASIGHERSTGAVRLKTKPVQVSHQAFPWTPMVVPVHVIKLYKPGAFLHQSSSHQAIICE
jgi:hypothetical protein